MTFLCLFLFFVTWTVLRNAGRVFCRMSLSLGVSDIFLMSRLGLWDFRKNIAQVKCLSLHIPSERTCYQHDLLLVMLTLVAWLRKCLPGFFTFPALLFRSKSLSPAHPQRGFCHFYNAVLGLIFSSFCCPTAGDEGLFKWWQGSDWLPLSFRLINGWLNPDIFLSSKHQWRLTIATQLHGEVAIAPIPPQ